jgi:hypothetical protein
MDDTKFVLAIYLIQVSRKHFFRNNVEVQYGRYKIGAGYSFDSSF